MSWSRMLAAAALLVSLAGPAAASEKPGADLEWVPEPMLFDLVRSLSARKGERELGVGVHQRGEEVEIGPEFEYVFADGQALELELLSPQQEHRAFKGVYQGMAGRAFGGRVLHGPHLTGGYTPSRQLLESSAVYVGCMRLDPTWSVIAMGGVEAERRGEENRFGPIANASLFADLHHSLILGLEGTWSQPGATVNRFEVLPQLRWDLDETLHLQAGYGATLEGGQARPLAALRVSHAF